MNSIGIEISKNGITVGAVRYDRRAELLGKTFSPILDSAENTLRTAAEAAVSLLNEVSLTADDIDYVGVTVDSAVKDNIAYDSVLGKKTDLSAILKYLPVKKLVSVKRANALAICEQIQTYGALYSIAYVELDEKVGSVFLSAASRTSARTVSQRTLPTPPYSAAAKNAPAETADALKHMFRLTNTSTKARITRSMFPTSRAASPM